MKAFAITGLKETGFVEKDERPVGAGEVRLKVDYVGFCGSDLNTYRGLNPLVKLPRVPGHEISATIAEVGAVAMVGGAIAWKTNVMTTAIMMYTNRGSFTLGIALGIILLGLSLVVNIVISLMQRRLSR